MKKKAEHNGGKICEENNKTRICLGFTSVIPLLLRSRRTKYVSRLLIVREPLSQCTRRTCPEVKGKNSDHTNSGCMPLKLLGLLFSALKPFEYLLRGHWKFMIDRREMRFVLAHLFSASTWKPDELKKFGISRYNGIFPKVSSPRDFGARVIKEGFREKCLYSAGRRILISPEDFLIVRVHEKVGMPWVVKWPEIASNFEASDECRLILMNRVSDYSTPILYSFYNYSWLRHSCFKTFWRKSWMYFFTK